MFADMCAHQQNLEVLLKFFLSFWSQDLHIIMFTVNMRLQKYYLHHFVRIQFAIKDNAAVNVFENALDLRSFTVHRLMDANSNLIELNNYLHPI